MITTIPPEKWEKIEIVGSAFTGHHKRPFVEVKNGEITRLFVSTIEAAYCLEVSKVKANQLLKEGKDFCLIDPSLAKEIFAHVDRVGMT
jgi:hypothetical protein